MSTIPQTPSKALVLATPTHSRAKYVAKQAASVAGWQAKNSYKYAGRVVKYSGFGIVYTVPSVVRFIRSDAKRDAREAARKTGNDKRISTATDSYRNSVILRLLLVFGPPLFILANLYNRIGNAAFAIMGATIAVALAITGARKQGKTILDRTPPRRSDLSQEVVDDALRAVRILRTPKNEYDTYGASVIIRMLPQQVKNEKGSVKATEIIFDLPPGCNSTARDVVKKKELIASHLGVLAEQLDIQTTRESDAQVSLWLFENDPLAGTPVPSPYPAEKRTSIWEGVRLGTDSRGLPAEIPLIWESVYVAGTPRKGKSSVVRLIAAAGALDPYLDFVVLDFKGGKDFKPLEQLTKRFVCGNTKKHSADALETLKDLSRTVSERYAIIAELSDEECPDGKLTRALAETHNLRPIMVVIDELEVGISAFEDNKERAEFENLISSIARSGPAAGVVFVVASQRPDGDSVPTKFRGIVTTRIAVQCTDGDSSDLVLGRGAASRGWNAARLPFVEGEAARCIVLTGGNGKVLKTDWLDLAEFRKICERGFHLRSAAGTLVEEEDKEPVNLLDFVVRELEKEDGLSASALCDRISDYKELSPKSLGKRLHALGVRSEDTSTGRKYWLRDARSAL